jgi:hypothetical protein
MFINLIEIIGNVKGRDEKFARPRATALAARLAAGHRVD